MYRHLVRGIWFAAQRQNVGFVRDELIDAVSQVVK